MPTDLRRVRRLNTVLENNDNNGPVVYWMSRDQRAEDNYALNLAIELANQRQTTLTVVFTLVPTFLEATWRQYEFLLRGLLTTTQKMTERGIEFILLPCSDPVDTMTELVKICDVSTLIVDYSPMRIGRQWRENVSKNISVPMLEVDAHNIVPVWTGSPKQEFAARTIRPKLNKLLPEFLLPIETIGLVKKSTDSTFSLFQKLQNLDFSLLKKHLNEDIVSKLNPSAQIIQQLLDNPKEFLNIDFEVLPYSKYVGGSEAGWLTFDRFCIKLENYDALRNNPNKDALSELSPYFHYGQLSCQAVGCRLLESFGNEHEGVNAFLEEMIIRRELSDNFCHYNASYDNYEGLADWAKKTLTKHWSDSRDYVYSTDIWEGSQTHDPLWNAANNQMKITGKMHGFMRMYWAKKILEWSASPSEAIRIAIYLNDKYSLDGRDPSGYVGVLWSVGGLHDRAWFERPVYGQIRYMNYNGCKTKFDVKEYESRWSR